MKKTLSFLTLSILFVLLLSSCSLHGVPVSIQGTWRSTDSISSSSLFQEYLKIGSDDTVSVSSDNNNFTKIGEITSCNCNRFTFKSSVGGITKEFNYADICDVLAIDEEGGSTYTFTKVGTLAGFVAGMDF